MRNTRNSFKASYLLANLYLKTLTTLDRQLVFDLQQNGDGFLSNQQSSLVSQTFEARRKALAREQPQDERRNSQQTPGSDFQQPRLLLQKVNHCLTLVQAGKAQRSFLLLEELLGVRVAE